MSDVLLTFTRWSIKNVFLSLPHVARVGQSLFIQVQYGAALIFSCCLVPQAASEDIVLKERKLNIAPAIKKQVRERC
jgi:hypothetical protein